MKKFIRTLVVRYSIGGIKGGMSMHVDRSLKEVSKVLCQCNLDELTAFLSEFGITMHNPDGSWKNTEELLGEIAEIWDTIQSD